MQLVLHQKELSAILMRTLVNINGTIVYICISVSGLRAYSDTDMKLFIGDANDYEVKMD